MEDPSPVKVEGGYTVSPSLLGGIDLLPLSGGGTGWG